MMATRHTDEAWVTLATNDTYAMSALVLSESLARVSSNRAKVILITTDVSECMQGLLRNSFTDVVTVSLIDSKDEKILSAMKRPELGVTLTKIHCWSLTQYKKCVFLDADTIVIKNSDELFEREELSAVPDIGWPDCFNSGVYVFVPSQETFTALVQLITSEGSFDGGDQGLLNTYFSDWFSSDSSKHLSFIYNMTLVATYSYPPAFKKFGQNVKIIHFLGSTKPWHYGFDAATRSVTLPHHAHFSQQADHVQRWWDIFLSEVKPLLTTDCTGICAHLSKLTLLQEPGDRGVGEVTEGQAAAAASGGEAFDPLSKRRQWETGQIDYMGGDAFESIQKKLDEKMSGKQE